jgi:bacterioferritin-associated ferredoxin
LSKTILCHCEDISLDELFSALGQGYSDIESLKRFTGIGTGKCQGKCCVIQTLRVLDSERGRKAIVSGFGTGPGSPLAPPTSEELRDRIRLPTIRQPVVPLAIDDIADGGETS